MHSPKIAIASFAFSFLMSPSAGGTPTAVVRTRETILRFRAGPEGPMLLHIGGVNGIWRNRAPEDLISTVTIEGRSMPVHWRFRRAATRASERSFSCVYDSTSPRLRLTWGWKAQAAFGPIEHVIQIQNLGTREVWIPMQDSLQFDFPIPPALSFEHFYVEKGAGAPSEIGTHRANVSMDYHWQGTSSTYAHPRQSEPREIIPFFAIQTSDTKQKGWYAGVEFSGRIQLTLERSHGSVHGRLGLNPNPGPFRTRLEPGATFVTPTVFVGEYAGGVDSLGNVLRPWVRRALGNPVTWNNPNYPLLVNNSWGSGMQVNDTLTRRMIRDSADLGLEMFHVDAGWFRGVGDWSPDPKKFPDGLAPIADDAHRHGLKFGIWADWTQAALDTQPGALNVRDPLVRDWLVSDLPADWKPEEFKGQTIDIGDPAAYAFARREVFRLVEDYHLDMLEHDGYLVAQGCVRENHPHAPPDPAQTFIVKQDGAYFVESTNSTDVSYHAVRAYYSVYRELRLKHPHVFWKSVTTEGGWWISAVQLMLTTFQSQTVMTLSRTGAHSTMPATSCPPQCWKRMWSAGLRPESRISDMHCAAACWAGSRL